MSFKREGDDGSQLNVLKKRRVADLLSSYIPSDEALLLKNGRYACTVCHHRPVFDTIDMLSVHRSGKKHISCLQRHYGKKLNYRNEIQKRQHQEYIRAEEAGEQLPKGPAPLLAQTRKITQHALLKAAPYNSCCSRKRLDAGKKTSPSEISHSPAPTVIAEHRHPVTSWPVPPEPTAGASHAEPTGCSSGAHKPSPVQKRSGRKKTRKSSGKGEEPGDDPERRREMQHYLLLRSSGWIPDGTGKWVKDESVEFDSDEEEPPAVPPP